VIPRRKLIRRSNSNTSDLRRLGRTTGRRRLRVNQSHRDSRIQTSRSSGNDILAIKGTFPGCLLEVLDLNWIYCRLEGGKHMNGSTVSAAVARSALDFVERNTCRCSMHSPCTHRRSRPWWLSLPSQANGIILGTTWTNFFFHDYLLDIYLSPGRDSPACSTSVRQSQPRRRVESGVEEYDNEKLPSVLQGVHIVLPPFR
jgi:hypothetical protein